MPESYHYFNDGSGSETQFNFIRQVSGPYYISTFTNYDLTGLTSTLDVFFTDFDTSIFVTETDAATNTLKLKFDLNSFAASGEA